MKQFKELLPSIIIALIGLALFAVTIWWVSGYGVEAEAFSPPCAGVGRVMPCDDSAMPSASYRQVTSKLIPDSEPKPGFDEDRNVLGTEETDLDALIVEVAGEYGLPWELVRAVCWVESGLDPTAISVTGDYGIMQVSYINHGAYGLDNPLDPEANLRAGCAILKDALDFCDGDFTKALMCYNRGRAYALAQWRDGIFSTAYTERVLERFYAYERGEYLWKS